MKTAIISKTAPVKAVLNELLRSQEQGNVEAFSKCFAHDSHIVNIGTDLDEIWHGWDSFFNWMQTAIQNKQGYSINEQDTQIHMGPSNDVAWYFQLLDTCFETKGEPVRIEGFRHTGVLEKRDGKWLIVQSHISTPDTALENDTETQ